MQADSILGPVDSITIFPGTDKHGQPERFSPIELSAGEAVSIVGPTGSGKTAFITDIELLAQGDTVTGRTVWVNGQVPPEEYRLHPALKPVAMITQNTKCFTDLSVRDFLAVHIRARHGPDRAKPWDLDPPGGEAVMEEAMDAIPAARAAGLPTPLWAEALIEDTIQLANQFTGEKIEASMRVTGLSGGQTRSLLIADAIAIGAAPVILLDEIENAGIFKHEVLKAIQASGKIVIFVTHDPVIALLTQKRIVMENGSVKKVLFLSPVESPAAQSLLELDCKLHCLREELRQGKFLTQETFHHLGLDFCLA